VETIYEVTEQDGTCSQVIADDAVEAEEQYIEAQCAESISLPVTVEFVGTEPGWEEFQAKHHPLKNPRHETALEGCLFDLQADDLKFISQQSAATVWTLVEGDFGLSLIQPGFHFVNRLGYLVTQVPYDDQMEIFVAG
jgi:hypothetical protein